MQRWVGLGVIAKSFTAIARAGLDEHDPSPAIGRPMASPHGAKAPTSELTALGRASPASFAIVNGYFCTVT